MDYIPISLWIIGKGSPRYFRISFGWSPLTFKPDFWLNKVINPFSITDLSTYIIYFEAFFFPFSSFQHHFRFKGDASLSMIKYGNYDKISKYDFGTCHADDLFVLFRQESCFAKFQESVVLVETSSRIEVMRGAMRGW